MARRKARPDPTILGLRGLVLLVVALQLGVLVGVVTFAASTNVYAAILAGVPTCGAAMVGLNALVGP